MNPPLNEDTLVQATTADYLEEQLGWESVFAYNNETYGKEGTLGRLNDKEVVLTRYLGEALVKFNPGLPDAAYQDALRQITEAPVTENTLQINYEQYERVKNGVQVQFRNDKGELEKKRLKVFDFDNPENNHFLCVRELWVRGDIFYSFPRRSMGTRKTAPIPSSPSFPRSRVGMHTESE